MAPLHPVTRDENLILSPINVTRGPASILTLRDISFSAQVIVIVEVLVLTFFQVVVSKSSTWAIHTPQSSPDIEYESPTPVNAFQVMGFVMVQFFSRLPVSLRTTNLSGLHFGKTVLSTIFSLVSWITISDAILMSHRGG